MQRVTEIISCTWRVYIWDMGCVFCAYIIIRVHYVCIPKSIISAFCLRLSEAILDAKKLKTFQNSLIKSRKQIRKMSYIVQITCLLATISLISGHFEYSKRGQHVWSHKFKLCSGKLQSPIPISSFKSVALPLPALEVIGYRNLLPRPLLLKNNGHSVVMSIKNNLGKNDLPYIFGAALKVNNEYEMDHLHFHWGGKNNRGSEHTFNGIRFPMEMHIVHRNRAYPNLSKALDHQDGLVVLGIFFQLQEDDNKLLSPILNDLTMVQLLDQEIQLNTSVTLASLMPHDIDVFYTYKGSLTTPPCNEVVTWIVFPKPVPISFRQINKFRTLSSGSDILVDNYRRMQDIGLRKVFVRKLSPSLITVYNAIQFLNVTNLNWFWQ